MRDGFQIADDFFDGAAEMRAAFEAHFADPARHTAEHQVWNYWHIPNLYTYLRAVPHRVVPEPLFHRFMLRLNAWAMGALGLSTRSMPWLSLYVNGCGQSLHNDAAGGQVGYVFSLTRWDARTFVGGETLILRADDYWGSERMAVARHAEAFCERVPSLFNRLLIFDDRLIHGVVPIQGTMDPLAGRVVIHGHLRANQAALTGGLTPQQSSQAAAPTLERVGTLARDHADRLHGFITLRLLIEPDGRVSGVRPLCDRLVSLKRDPADAERFTRDVFALLTGIAFPAAAVPSELTLPVLVGVA